MLQPPNKAGPEDRADVERPLSPNPQGQLETTARNQISYQSLDFLGLGLPPGSPSLGELLNQGKQNLQAPWLGFTTFTVLAVLLSLLVFIGEAVRDAFDARETG